MSDDDFLGACAARDWPRAVAMVERDWTRLVFSRATYQALFTLLVEAPEEELRRRPRAALIAESLGRLPRGTVPVRLPSDPVQVERSLRAGHARELVELAVLGMVSRRATGLPGEALAIARVSRPLLRSASLTRFSPAADLAAYWHLQAAQAALHADEADQALLDVEQAWSLRGDDVTGYVAASSAPFGVLLAALAGDAAARRRWQAEVDAIAVTGRDTLIEWPTMERPALVAALLDATDRLDHGAAGPLVDVLVPQLAFDELWPVTLTAIVRHLVDTGATDRAEQLITTTVERHATAPRTGSFHASFTALARAEVARALGRAGALERLLADEAPLPPLGALHATHLALLLDDPSAARRLAAEAEHAATDERGRRESRLLGTALALPGTVSPVPPLDRLPDVLRRLATQLPTTAHARLRASYDGVPASRVVPASEPPVRLTPAEARVLAALDGPATLAEVAELLHVSRNTLKTHLRSLYAKLGASSRAEALAGAGRLGLLGLLGNDAGPPP